MNWSAWATIWSSTRISQCRLAEYGHWIDSSIPASFGIGQNRVHLERLAGQHRGLGAVDVLVIDLVGDHCTAGCSVRACAVDDVVQHFGLGRSALGCRRHFGLGAVDGFGPTRPRRIIAPAATATAAMASQRRLVELMTGDPTWLSQVTATS